MDKLIKPQTLNAENGDYIDSDGLIVCGVCGKRRQTRIELWGKETAVPINCDCTRAESVTADKRVSLQRVRSLRKDGMFFPENLIHTFSVDDERYPHISTACKRYVAEWEAMKAKNCGMIISGDFGTGKSFYSDCIANALTEQGVPVGITNFPTILDKMQGFGDDRQDFFDRLMRYQLLVIDDLGTERETSYADERVNLVIDTRKRMMLPLIVTTNISLSKINEMKGKSETQIRLHDRIVEMCPIQLSLTGASRRGEISAEKAKAAKKLLGM